MLLKCFKYIVGKLLLAAHIAIAILINTHPKHVLYRRCDKNHRDPIHNNKINQWVYVQVLNSNLSIEFLSVWLWKWSGRVAGEIFYLTRMNFLLPNYVKSVIFDHSLSIFTKTMKSWNMKLKKNAFILMCYYYIWWKILVWCR